jgi:hypothetical protein
MSLVLVKTTIALGNGAEFLEPPNFNLPRMKMISPFMQ